MNQKNSNSLRFCLFWVVSVIVALTTDAKSLRPPSVPLVACDPYFSIWSPGDKPGFGVELKRELLAPFKG